VGSENADDKGQGPSTVKVSGG